MEEKIFDGAFYGRLHNLAMTSRLKLSGGMSGGRKSNAKGSSVEFSDFREYILGDDIRRIDWNAYGRMDKLFVKLFMEEKEGLFHIVLDCSKSMDFGEKKKSIMAQRIAGMLSYLVINNMDRVYLTTLKEEQSFTTKGMTGRQSFQKILKMLEETEFVGALDLRKEIMAIPFGKKGVTIVISDFFDNQGIESWLKYLKYKKQEVILIHTLAQEEVEPESDGSINYIDSENQENLKVTITTQVLKNYKKTLEDFQNTVKGSCKKYQANYIPVVTSEPLEKFIFQGIRMGQWG